jgi:cell division protein FtsB
MAAKALLFHHQHNCWQQRIGIERYRHLEFTNGQVHQNVRSNLPN